ncbi:hypothetical protein Tsubulata_026453, partial [Turnera subulata]
MRGTIGYLAPEWISGVAITAKADVYSYGMMLFELISGRRNSDQPKDGRMEYFPALVASLLNNKGDVLSLLDPRLEENANVEEVTRICRLACWCIQDDETQRPAMGQEEEAKAQDARKKGNCRPREARVLTTMRGTIGYLAPEWISGVAITAKADVYSYGMMLFELVSGRRNSAKPEDGKMEYFPLQMASLINEQGDVLGLLDPRLERNADVEELTRLCRLACWCIQDEESQRPSMGQIARILEGCFGMNLPPIPRFLRRVLTTMRGTIGYLAPEWITGAAVTAKADVYSYGMMLFEMVSGRRNSEQPKEGEREFFPVKMSSIINNQGDVLSLLDPKLEGSAEVEEVTRMCKVACWCIQDDEAQRPTMGQVILFLEGLQEMNLPPISRFLQSIGYGTEDTTVISENRPPVPSNLHRVLTTMRGTIGYLAPEWITGVAVTAKADVYSYGMMLFELVSGRRNTEQPEGGRTEYFPVKMARLVNMQGDVLSLLDPKLEGNADAEEVTRLCKVACWCIQDDEEHRPTMGQVILFLEGLQEMMNLPPIPKVLQSLEYSEEDTIWKSSETETNRVLTTMRGTIGYLAPEWITGVAVTTKADVYSYGMMLFELVSGRRNSETPKDGRTEYFPVWMASVINEQGDVLSLLDPKLEGSADIEEVKRLCKVACWCIQDDETQRPTMGQIFGRDFSRVLTTMRGTIGYLAPEWITGEAVTAKADVYSYGMMLFELVSGKRNSEQPKDGGMEYVPVKMASLINNQGDILSLLDPKLEGNVDVEEVTRVCKVACWCIQEDETQRPTMG